MGALKLAKGKQVNIYTDSRYAFATIHVHGAIYKERGLLTTTSKEIQNKKEILLLLEAAWEPATVAVMHCRSHQRVDALQVKGNCLADQAAAQHNIATKLLVTPVVSSLLTTEVAPV